MRSLVLGLGFIAAAFFSGCTGVQHSEQVGAAFGTYYNATIIPADDDILLIADSSNSDKVEGIHTDSLPVSTATQAALDAKQAADDDLSDLADGSLTGSKLGPCANTTGALPTTSGVTDGYVPKKQSDGSVAWRADSTGTGGDQLVDGVCTTPLLINGLANVNNIWPGSDADITFSMPAATNSNAGYATAAQITALEAALTVSGTPTVGDLVVRNAADDGLEYETPKSANRRVTVHVGGSGDVITAGTKYTTYFKTPYELTLDGILFTTAETLGSCTIDVWVGKEDAVTGLANISDADSLFDTATEPSIADASTDRATWVTSFDSGENIIPLGGVIGVTVDACTTLTHFMVVFHMTEN